MSPTGYNNISNFPINQAIFPPEKTAKRDFKTWFDYELYIALWSKLPKKAILYLIRHKIWLIRIKQQASER